MGSDVVAVPVMVILMLMTAQRRIMGEFTIGGWLRALGWMSTVAMAACVGGMFATWLVWGDRSGSSARPIKRFIRLSKRIS